MALERVALPTPTSPTAPDDYTAILAQLEAKNQAFTGAAVPDLVAGVIRGGRVFDVGGVLYKATSDTTITGTDSIYVKITPSGASATAEFVASLTGVTWNEAYGGYYDGSGNLYIFDEARAVYDGVVTNPKTVLGQVERLKVERLTAETLINSTLTGNTYNDTAYGPGASASGLESVALGPGASATSDYCVSVGRNCTASGLYSVALGRSSNAVGNASLALGFQAATSGQNAVSLGTGSTAAESGISVGGGADAVGANSIAIGGNSTASGSSSISLGNFVETDYANEVGVGSIRMIATASMTSNEVYNKINSLTASGSRQVITSNNGTGFCQLRRSGSSYVLEAISVTSGSTVTLDTYTSGSGAGTSGYKILFIQ